MDNSDKNKNNSFQNCECGKEEDGRKLRGAHKAFGGVFLHNRKYRLRGFNFSFSFSAWV